MLTLKDYHVTRVSVNPQTMQARTLKRIGRSHTPEDIVAMYALGYYMHESHPVRLDHLCLNTVQRRNPCDICGTVCPKGLSIYESNVNCELFFS